jgi:hypothetical protein
MEFQGALVKEQNVTFAIVVVKQQILNNSSELHRVRAGYTRYFPGVPLVLMAQDHRGIPVFHGRTDLVNFLSRIEISRIPWKKYSTN